MAENMEFLPKKDILSLQEIDRIATNLVALGVKKLRLTGGEPLVRRDVAWLIERLGRLHNHGLHELTLTTNGTQLPKYAQILKDNGVKRINVSLDTLDSEKFTQITRWGKISQVFNGLEAAQKAGLKVKINCVALRNFNDAEMPNLVIWCGQNGFDISFIEVMPMGDLGEVDRLGQYYPLSMLRADLARKFTLNASNYQTGGPSRYFDCQETGQRIGFITPMTHNFCESCNRIRLSSTGMLYLCLGQDNNYDLRRVIRQSDDDEILQNAIRQAITLKPKGHDFDLSRQENGKISAVNRHMNTTGG